MKKKRSVGVIIVGVTTIIIGLLQLYAYFSLLFLPSINLLNLIIPISIALSFGFSGIFVLKLKNWARILLMLQMVYWAILGLKGIHAFYILDLVKIGEGGNYPESWLGWLAFFLLPSIVLIYYLTRPKVKAKFTA